MTETICFEPEGGLPEIRQARALIDDSKRQGSRPGLFGSRVR